MTDSEAVRVVTVVCGRPHVAAGRETKKGQKKDERGAPGGTVEIERLLLIPRK